MNSSHVSVGVSATAATAYLTTLLTGYHGIDAEHAAAAAGLIVMLAGAVYAVAVWFVGWRWPAVPPLPRGQVETHE